jgi:hypothetical protein
VDSPTPILRAAASFSRDGNRLVSTGGLDLIGEVMIGTPRQLRSRRRSLETRLVENPDI